MSVSQEESLSKSLSDLVGEDVKEAKPYSVMPAANRWRRCPSARASANN